MSKELTSAVPTGHRFANDGDVVFSRPVDAFMEGLSRKIGQPINENGEYVIGARVVLGTQWADTVYISTMRTPDKYRGKGLARFAIDEIVSLADRYGVTLKTDCSGVNNPEKGLSTEHLRRMFERRDFQVTHEYAVGGYEMVRKPL